MRGGRLRRSRYACGAAARRGGTVLLLMVAGLSLLRPVVALTLHFGTTTLMRRQKQAASDLTARETLRLRDVTAETTRRAIATKAAATPFDDDLAPAIGCGWAPARWSCSAASRRSCGSTRSASTTRTCTEPWRRRVRRDRGRTIRRRRDRPPRAQRLRPRRLRPRPDAGARTRVPVCARAAQAVGQDVRRRCRIGRAARAAAVRTRSVRRTGHGRSRRGHRHRGGECDGRLHAKPLPRCRRRPGCGTLRRCGERSTDRRSTDRPVAAFGRVPPPVAGDLVGSAGRLAGLSPGHHVVLASRAAEAVSDPLLVVGQPPGQTAGPAVGGVGRPAVEFVALRDRRNDRVRRSDADRPPPPAKQAAGPPAFEQDQPEPPQQHAGVVEPGHRLPVGRDRQAVAGGLAAAAWTLPLGPEPDQSATARGENIPPEEPELLIDQRLPAHANAPRPHSLADGVHLQPHCMSCDRDLCGRGEPQGRSLVASLGGEPHRRAVRLGFAADPAEQRLGLVVAALRRQRAREVRGRSLWGGRPRRTRLVGCESRPPPALGGGQIAGGVRHEAAVRAQSERRPTLRGRSATSVRNSRSASPVRPSRASRTARSRRTSSVGSNPAARSNWPSAASSCPADREIAGRRQTGLGQPIGIGCGKRRPCRQRAGPFGHLRSRQALGERNGGAAGCRHRDRRDRERGEQSDGDRGARWPHRGSATVCGEHSPGA